MLSRPRGAPALGLRPTFHREKNSSRSDGIAPWEIAIFLPFFSYSFQARARSYWIIGCIAKPRDGTERRMVREWKERKVGKRMERRRGE